jgi:hypothetical protein
MTFSRSHPGGWVFGIGFLSAVEGLAHGALLQKTAFSGSFSSVLFCQACVLSITSCTILGLYVTFELDVGKK